MRRYVRSFILSIKNNDGATAVEYAIMLALIAGTIIVAVGVLGEGTRDGFDTVNTELSEITPEQNKCGDKDSPDDKDCGLGNDNP